jgi:hypothetical protein
MKLSAVTAVVLGSAVASPAVFAHASYVLNGGAGGDSNSLSSTLEWLNGVPSPGVESQDSSAGANMPIAGFAGIHGATTSNNRVMETGVYGPKTGTGAVTTAQLGGLFGNNPVGGTGQITPGQGNTLLGQLYTYNQSNTPYTNNPSVSVTNGGTGFSVSQGSLTASNLSDINSGNNTSIYNPTAAGAGSYNSNGFNTGLLYEQPYAGSGSTATNPYGGNPSATLGSQPNGEEYIIQTTGAQYLNVAIAADNFAVTGVNNINTAAGQTAQNDLLTYAIYQGDPTGPGLQGLTLLGTGEASSLGGEVDFSIHLTGSYLNNAPQTGGDFTLVVGDASQSTNSTAANYVAASNFDPYVKVGLWETGTGLTSTGATVATANSGGAFSTLYQEQGTLPTSSVPVPGAVWLFGSAMAGFAGFGRRKQVSA